ncbi:3'-5' exonuclease, partial [Vibrio sinaloensis]
TNIMLRDAPSCDEVMAQFAQFIAGENLVAHNASFDKRFLDDELERVSAAYSGEFACSLLVSRRLNQDAPSHKLGDLVRFKQIDNDGVFHRALADAEMTAKLWMLMVNDLQSRGISEPSFALMQKIGKTSKSAIDKLLSSQGA